jgi:hypothetical protein
MVKRPHMNIGIMILDGFADGCNLHEVRPGTDYRKDFIGHRRRSSLK